MSILIKGMEMPHDCDECRLCAFIPVGDYGVHRKCLPLNAKAEITIRRANCPLVPIPPHGDLIDRDALSKSLDALCDRVCQYSKAQRKVMCSACPLGDAFAVVEDDVPPIIEAEEGE